MDTSQGSSQIFCLTWVKRNVAKGNPDNIRLDDEEMDKIMRKTSNSITEDDNDEWEDMESENEQEAVNSTTKNDNEKISATEKENFDDLKEYDLDHYDSDDENARERLSSLVAFTNNSEDPYITKKDKENEEDSECELEEKEAVKIQPDDNLLVCIKNTKQFSTLEVYVYNHVNGDFYVHHDIPLSRTPLCVEWIGYDPGSDEANGNLLSAGTMENVIEIWDLDVMNSLEPIITLGNKKKKKSKKKRTKVDGHTDAVLDLSWSPTLKSTLASCSVDETIRLWDIEMGINSSTLNYSSKLFITSHHKPLKVQTIQWRSGSTSEILSGSFSAEVCLADVKSNDRKVWEIDGEVERVIWHPENTNYAAASSDTGYVSYIDVRKPNKLLNNWRAHDNAIPGLSFITEGTKLLLCTASSDETSKLWDIENQTATLICEKHMKMGMIHCCSNNPDEQHVMAFGGQKDSVKLWNTLTNSEAQSYLKIGGVGNNNSEISKIEDDDDDGEADILTYYGKSKKSSQTFNSKKKKRKKLSNNY